MYKKYDISKDSIFTHKTPGGIGNIILQLLEIVLYQYSSLDICSIITDEYKRNELIQIIIKM